MYKSTLHSDILKAMSRDTIICMSFRVSFFLKFTFFAKKALKDFTKSKMLSKFFFSKKIQPPDHSENAETILVLLEHCRLCLNLRKPKFTQPNNIKNLVMTELCQVLEKIVEINTKAFKDLWKISEMKEQKALKKAEKEKRQQETWKDFLNANSGVYTFKNINIAL